MANRPSQTVPNVMNLTQRNLTTFASWKPRILFLKDTQPFNCTDCNSGSRKKKL